MAPAPIKRCIGNINPQKLLLEDIWFHKLKLQMAEDDYHKATLNNDYQSLNFANESRIYHKATILQAYKALRYLLAAEAEASGRQVSDTMEEFDEVIGEMINGNQ